MDEIDKANDRAQQILDEAISAARKEIPKGEPGVCRLCEVNSPRLIGGVCARCRDIYKLP